MVAGKVEPSGKTAWAPIYEGKRRVRASRALVAEHLGGSWSASRLAVQGPTEVRDVILDFDDHFTDPVEAARRDAEIDAVIDRLRSRSLRLRFVVLASPRGRHLLVPLDRPVDAVMVKNTFKRLLLNQRLVGEGEVADVVRTGIQTPTAAPFMGGALLYVHGRGEVCEPLETPGQRASAFEGYCAIRPNRIEDLAEFSMRPRRSPGRPRRGPSGVVPSLEQDGDQLSQGASRAAATESPYSFTSTGVGGESNEAKDQYLRFPASAPVRERIGQLIELAELSRWEPSSGIAGNSASFSPIAPAEGLVPGSRRRLALAMVHRALSMGWAPERILTAVVAWIASQPHGSSADWDANPAAVVADIARTILDAQAWRQSHPGSPAPRLVVDQRDVQALVDRGVRPARAGDVGKVVEALRQRHRVGDEVFISTKWIALITGRSKPAILTEIRREIVRLGLVEMTAPADRHRHQATTYRIASLQVRPAPVLLLFPPTVPISADVYDPRRQAEAAVALDEAFRRLQNALRLPLAA